MSRLNPKDLLDELAALQSAGNEIDLTVSDRTGIIFPYHRILEGMEELLARAEGMEIDTTMKGVGPAYQDKAGRYDAIVVGDLLDRDRIAKRLRLTLPKQETKVRGLQDLVSLWIDKGKIKVDKEDHKDQKLLASLARFAFDHEEWVGRYAGYGNDMRRYVADTSDLITDALQQGRNVIFEGAQGALLDQEHANDPPNSTSSRTLAGAVTLGAGVPLKAIDEVVGVFKIGYSNRVGNGDMPHEIHGELAEWIRNKGREFGSRTGRPRRIGWPCRQLMERSAQLNGYTGVVFVGFNVLEDAPELQACDYENGSHDLVAVRPWGRIDVEKVKRTGISSLPREAQDYIARMQEPLNAPIYYLALGFDRDEELVLKEIF